MKTPKLSLALLGLAALLLPLSATAQKDGPLEKVTVKVVQEGEPVAGQKLRLIGEPPGGGQITFGEGTTDEEGIFRADVPFRPGVVLFAEGHFDGVKFTSPEVPFVGDPGAGLELTMKVFSSTASTLQDLSFGPDSHVSIDIQEGFLEITQVLFIINKGKGAYSPEGGFALNLPKGFRDVSGVGGNPVFTLEHVGASIPGPFLPGQTEVQVRYELPFDTSTYEFSQKLEVPWPQARAFVHELPGLEFTGPQVEQQELREASGRQWRLATLRPQAGSLSFTMSGLPVRSHSGRWIALGLSVVVALFGFLGGIAPVKDSDVKSTARTALLAERASLLAELEALDLDKREGRIESETFDEDRAAAIDQLAAVLRALDSGEASGNQEQA